MAIDLITIGTEAVMDALRFEGLITFEAGSYFLFGFDFALSHINLRFLISQASKIS